MQTQSSSDARSSSKESPADSEGDLSAACPVLLTKSLVLRPPHVEDIEALAILADNPTVATMVSRMPHPYSRQDAEDFVKSVQIGRNGKCIYAITVAETGHFIGCCALEAQGSQIGARTGADGMTLELGYWLGQPWWGHGYATEAIQALVDMAFRSGTTGRIDARCRVTNPASRRVLQKSGFQFQGMAMCPSLALGTHVPVEWFRLDRKTWLSLVTWSHNNSRHEDGPRQKGKSPV